MYYLSSRATSVRANAFTLIEIIVVVSIIAVLSTIGFLAYSGSVTDARDTTRKADMAELKVRLRATKQKTGAYPLPTSYFSLTNS